MADKEKNVVLNFKMDGQVQYAQTLKDINRVMNTAAKEYKNHIAAMGKDANATDKLRAEKKKLEIQMEGAQKRTKMLRDEYEAMSKDTNTSSKELDKMYGKLLDSERAEIQLQKSLDRVNDGLSDQAQEARAAQDNLDKLKAESKLLESEQKSLTSSFKLQTAELGDNATEAEKAELAQKQLQAQMKLTDRTVENLERQLEETKKVYGENSVEVNQLETKMNDARTTMKKFEKSLDGVEDSTADAGDGLEELNGKMDLNNLLEAVELLEGVSDALFDVGKSATDSYLEFGDSQTYLQANLGLTADEASKLNEVVNDVFRHGVVGSMEEASEAVMLVKQSFGNLNDAELEKLTNNITTIAKRTGTDVNENVLAASRLMEEFGLTGEEAMDLIAAGYQNGLNKTDDFLETLNEFSPHFESAGYSANEMLQILSNGLENGSMNANKAADAVKEFQVKLGDGSVEKIIGNYSKETQEMFNKWKEGKATTADVATSISKDLNKMSPNEQQVAISELASQFEDLGVDGAAALFTIGEGFDDVNGKADEMSQRAPGEKLIGGLRDIGIQLLPVGQQLADLAEDVLPPVVAGLQKLNDWFTNLPGPLQTFITVFGGLMAVAIALTPVIIALAVAIGSLEVALLPIIAVVLLVAAAIAGIVVAIQNWGSITDWFSEKWNQFTAWLTEVVPKLAADFISWFLDMKNGAVQKFNELKDGAIGKVKDLKDGGIKLLKGFKDGAIDKAKQMKDDFVNKANELKDGAVDKFNDLKKRGTDAVIGFKDNVFGKVSDLKSAFVDRVSSLKDGAIDKFNNLKDRAGQVMQSAKDKILSPIETARDKVSGIVDKITGFFSDMRLKIPKPSLPSLPHFSLEWGSRTIMGKTISYPSGIDVDWWAKGGIFTQPTIFGASGGRLQGAGEAGPEAVLPLNDKTLGSIGEGIAKTMNQQEQKQPLIVQMITPDKRVLAEMVVDDVSDMQARKQSRKRRRPRGS
ncbi:phage tail tape measure protein [Sediminibacillus sp. JSM 1682029]|uniref:phage tail tape measure protein n=1 Tax=Sediminibacillus sp. JSM 1682029 TaxID=3229857 RepID=UPI003524038E